MHHWPDTHTLVKCISQLDLAAPPSAGSADDPDPSSSSTSSSCAAYDGSHPVDAAAALEAALAASDGAALAWTVPWVLRYLWFLKWDIEAAQAPYFRWGGRHAGKAAARWHSGLRAAAWMRCATFHVRWADTLLHAHIHERLGLLYIGQLAQSQPCPAPVPTGACCAAWPRCMAPLSCGPPSRNSVWPPSACGRCWTILPSGWAQI